MGVVSSRMTMPSSTSHEGSLNGLMSMKIIWCPHQISTPNTLLWHFMVLFLLSPIRAQTQKKSQTSQAADLTRTFFNFMSRCRRPWPCRKRIPSTTSRAIWSLSLSDKPAWLKNKIKSETVRWKIKFIWHKPVSKHGIIQSPSGLCRGLCAAAP